MSKKAFRELAQEDFILYFNSQLVITNKFLRYFKKPPIYDEDDLKKEEISTMPVVVSNQEVVIEKEQLPEGVTVLMKFIVDAEVPAKSRTDKPYAINKYNSKAENILVKALKSKNPVIDYNVLVLATKLYYKGTSYPKTIANYFLDGLWQGEYQSMIEAAKTNTVVNHIEINMNSGDIEGFTRYRR